MAFYRQQQTTNAPPPAAEAPSAGNAGCLSECKRTLEQCLIDATTFGEKQECRRLNTICKQNCGPAVAGGAGGGAGRGGLAAAAPLAFPPPAGAAGAAGAATALTCEEKCEKKYPEPRRRKQEEDDYANCIANCPEAACTGDADCVAKHGPGWTCGTDGKCVAPPVVGPHLECTGNAECIAKLGEGAYCGEDGICVPPKAKSACALECMGNGFREGTPNFFSCVTLCEERGKGDCVDDAPCWTSLDCKGGECIGASFIAGAQLQGKCKCVGAKCSDKNPCTPPLVCNKVTGKCEKPKCDPKNPASCPTGFHCDPVSLTCVRTVKCSDTKPCPDPKKQKCVNGTCQDIDITGDCPKGNIYNAMVPKCDPVDAKGNKLYKFVKRPNNGNRDDWAVEIEPVPGAVGTCECLTWITDGEAEKCVEGTVCKNDKVCNGGKCVDGKCSCPSEGLGEYNWPPELTDLYNRLMGRSNEYLSRKPGYSQSALDAAFGKGYENVRNLGKATTDQTIASLQREGMLGTGAGQAALRQIPWQTEKGVSDVIRDVFLGNEEQKRKDLESYTGIAQNLFGTGTNFKTILESINAARRGEGQNALAMWMDYITRLMGNWKS